MSSSTRRIRTRVLRPIIAGLAIAVAGGLTLVDPVAAAPPAIPGAAGSTVPGRCTQYEDELRTHAPPGGWDVTLMSTFMSRESACTPTARSARDTGLLQINDINHAYLRTALGGWVGRWSLTEPVQNIRAAAALCQYWQQRGESCYFPWKLDLYQAPSSPTTAPTPAATTPAPTKVSASPPAVAPTAGRCTQYEVMLAASAPAGGWDVVRMSRLMSSTSGCNPLKRWSTATGLLRISDVNQTWLHTQLGRRIDRAALTDPVQNIRAAAALCTASVARGRSCYQPWGPA